MTVFINTMRGWVRGAPKQGGANYPGDLGAWYSKNGKSTLFKQDVSLNRFTGKKTIHTDKMICEVVSMQLMQLLNSDAPDFFATVDFAVSPEIDPEEFKPTDAMSQHIYVSSENVGIPLVLTQEQKEEIDFRDLYNKYVSNFGVSIGTYDEVLSQFYEKGCLDLYKHAYMAYNFSPMFEQLRTIYGLLEIPKKRPVFAMLNKEPLRSVMLSERYAGFHRIIAASLMVDDPDVNTGNFMVVPLSRADLYHKKLVRIDSGAALKDLDDDLHLYDVLRYPPLLGPTNHNLDFSNEIIIHEEMAEAAHRLASFDKQKLIQGINKILDNVCLYFGPKDLFNFAVRMGVNPKMIANPQDKSEIIKIAKNFLIQKQIARLTAVARLERDIKVSDLFERDNDGNFQLLQKTKDVDHLVKFIKHHSAYFIDCFHGQDEFYFLAKSQNDQRYELTRLLNEKTREIFPELKDKRYLIPWRIRIRGAIHATYNNGDFWRSDVRAVLGIPSNWSYFNLLETILGWGLLITPIKNFIFKPLLELTPFLIQETLHFALDWLRMIKPSGMLNNAAIIALSSLCQISMVSAFLFRQITMRITSPVQALFRAKTSSKYALLNHALMGVSILTSISAAIILSPLILDAMAFMFGGNIMLDAMLFAGWLANIPYVGMAFGEIGAALSHLGIINVALASASSAIATAFMTIIIPLRVGLKHLEEKYHAWQEKRLLNAIAEQQIQTLRVYRGSNTSHIYNGMRALPSSAFQFETEKQEVPEIVSHPPPTLISNNFSNRRK